MFNATTPNTSKDLGGQTSIRPYWRCYYANTAAVIFVIDSTDIDRLGTASEELAAMLNEDELKDAALLVFANKQDQPGAKGAGEISEALKLGELRDRNWSIVACSAVDGSGVNEGMDWLVVSQPSEPAEDLFPFVKKRKKHSQNQKTNQHAANRPIRVMIDLAYAPPKFTSVTNSCRCMS